MVKNHKLAKSITQVGWGQFCTMLKYKAEWQGKTYLEVDRFFPSSKTYNNCLAQVNSLPLDVRFWECPNCGARHNRDINAAKNIRDEGLRIIKVASSDVKTEACDDNKTSGTGDKAYRQTVRRSNRGRKKSTC